MTKHHAKHKRRHNADNQAGFVSISLKEIMSKQNKLLILLISLGIIVLFVLSFMIIMNRDEAGEDAINPTPTPVKVVTTPYPTIPQAIKDTTILVNSRAINPLSVEITKGGTVGFLNEDSEPVEIQGYDNGSSLLNIGLIQSYDVPFVQFDQAGVYRFVNPQNRQEVGEIIVTE